MLYVVGVVIGFILLFQGVHEVRKAARRKEKMRSRFVSTHRGWKRLSGRGSRPSRRFEQ